MNRRCWFPVEGIEMTRYFFNVVDGRGVVDAVGTELADDAKARAEAIRSFGELLCEVDRLQMPLRS